MIMRDANIHLDVAENSNTVKFRQPLDNNNLLQHVTGSTHIGGQTLEVVIARSDIRVSYLFVDDLVMLDQSSK